MIQDHEIVSAILDYAEHGKEALGRFYAMHGIKPEYSVEEFKAWAAEEGETFNPHFQT